LKSESQVDVVRYNPHRLLMGSDEQVLRPILAHEESVLVVSEKKYS